MKTKLISILAFVCLLIQVPVFASGENPETIIFDVMDEEGRPARPSSPPTMAVQQRWSKQRWVFDKEYAPEIQAKWRGYRERVRSSTPEFDASQFAVMKGEKAYEELVVSRLENLLNLLNPKHIKGLQPAEVQSAMVQQRELLLSDILDLLCYSRYFNPWLNQTAATQIAGFIYWKREGSTDDFDKNPLLKEIFHHIYCISPILAQNRYVQENQEGTTGFFADSYRMAAHPFIPLLPELLTILKGDFGQDHVKSLKPRLEDCFKKIMLRHDYFTYLYPLAPIGTAIDNICKCPQGTTRLTEDDQHYLRTQISVLGGLIKQYIMYRHHLEAMQPDNNVLNRLRREFPWLKLQYVCASSFYHRQFRKPVYNGENLLALVEDARQLQRFIKQLEKAEQQALCGEPFDVDESVIDFEFPAFRKIAWEYTRYIALDMCKAFVKELMDAPRNESVQNLNGATLRFLQMFGEVAKDLKELSIYPEFNALWKMAKEVRDDLTHTAQTRRGLQKLFSLIDMPDSTQNPLTAIRLMLSQIYSIFAKLDDDKSQEIDSEHIKNLSERLGDIRKHFQSALPILLSDDKEKADLAATITLIKKQDDQQRMKGYLDRMISGEISLKELQKAKGFLKVVFVKEQEARDLWTASLDSINKSLSEFHQSENDKKRAEKNRKKLFIIDRARITESLGMLVDLYTRLHCIREQQSPSFNYERTPMNRLGARNDQFLTSLSRDLMRDICIAEGNSLKFIPGVDAYWIRDVSFMRAHCRVFINVFNNWSHIHHFSDPGIDTHHLEKLRLEIGPELTEFLVLLRGIYQELQMP